VIRAQSDLRFDRGHALNTAGSLACAAVAHASTKQPMVA